MNGGILQHYCGLISYLIVRFLSQISKTKSNLKKLLLEHRQVVELTDWGIGADWIRLEGRPPEEDNNAWPFGFAKTLIQFPSADNASREPLLLNLIRGKA